MNDANGVFLNRNKCSLITGSPGAMLYDQITQSPPSISFYSEREKKNADEILEEVHHHWGKQAPSPKINQTKDETQNTYRYYSTRLLIAVVRWKRLRLRAAGLLSGSRQVF